MRIVLTGANGFVGSHVLDGLVAVGHDVSVLLRPTSDTSSIRHHLHRVRVHYGSLEDVDSLRGLVSDAEAVVHCAAATKALSRAGYHAVNADGTSRLLEACSGAGQALRRFVLMSSLAVTGPGTPDRPARESAEPAPVTEYGRSKLEAERRVREGCRVGYTILRPAAVYGPRDRDFYLAFKAVKRGLAPLVSGGRQPISLVYAGDVARAVRAAIECEAASGQTYHVAYPEPCTQAGLLAGIAECMGAKPLRLRLPRFVFCLACAAHELRSRITRRPSIVNLGKIPEYSAPGWVCTTDRARDDMGFSAETGLMQGLGLALEWYRANGWL